VTAPLAGVKVIEVATFVAGPFCAMLLGDLGAEVIKVESPPAGDPIRNREDESGYGAGFAAINRNKKSVFLDLHQESARQTLQRLVATADVIITSVRPRSRSSLGLAPTPLLQANPRLIYLSLTGQGERPEVSDRPAFDTTIQAQSGLLHLIGAQTGRPMPVRILLADQLAAVYGALGIVAALVRRSATGRGGIVRTSMLEATIAFATLNHSLNLAAATPDRSTQIRSAGYLLLAGDGLAFAAHVPPSPDSNWRHFVDALEIEELKDERFATKELREANHAAIHEMVARKVGTAPRAVWLERLARADIAAAPINQLHEVFSDPVVAGLGMLSQIDGPRGKALPTIRAGVTFDAERLDSRRAPLAGEHTDEVLGDLL
jgi:crotonobetainyl-CoA:carnitine CoA-transferase CaiB-like acyl-CoA transferase